MNPIGKSICGTDKGRGDDAGSGQESPRMTCPVPCQVVPLSFSINEFQQVQYKMEETVNFYSKKGKIFLGLIILLLIAIIYIGIYIYMFPSFSTETAPIKQKICLYASPFLFILIIIVLYPAFRTYSFVSKGLAVLIFTPKEIRLYNGWIND